MKRCKRCGLKRPIFEFSLDRYAADGHVGICKPCRHEVYLENREVVAAQARKWYAQNTARHKAKSIAHYQANLAHRSRMMAAWYQRRKQQGLS